MRHIILLVVLSLSSDTAPPAHCSSTPRAPHAFTQGFCCARTILPPTLVGMARCTCDTLPKPEGWGFFHSTVVGLLSMRPRLDYSSKSRSWAGIDAVFSPIREHAAGGVPSASLVPCL